MNEMTKSECRMTNLLDLTTDDTDFGAGAVAAATANAS